MRFCERLAREHARLLLDVLARPLELGLLRVELLLAPVEELLQRGLRADAVLGLHDRVLHVDDGDPGLGGGDARHGEGERHGGGAGDRT